MLTPRACEAFAHVEVAEGAPTGDLPPAQREIEARLHEAAGGLPVLVAAFEGGDLVLGHAQAKECLPDAEPTIAEGPLFAARRYPDGKRAPWYLGEAGELVTPGEGIFAASIWAELERWLRAPVATLPHWLEAAGGHGEAWAEALGLAWIVEASDDACLFWGDEAVMIVEASARTRLAASSFARLGGALGAAHRVELPVRLRTRSPCAREPLSATTPRDRPPEYRRPGFLETRIHAEDDGLVEETLAGGVLVAALAVEADAATLRQGGAAAPALKGLLSERALAYVADRGMIRDTTQSCSAEALAAAFTARGRALAEPLTALEERFGGLVVPHPRDPALLPSFLFGVHAMLMASGSLRRRLEGDQEDDELFEPLGYPQVRYRHDTLTLVGVSTFEEHLYADESGAIYHYASAYDIFEARAGSAAAYLERLALAWEAERKLGVTAHLTFDGLCGDALAKQFGVPPLPAPSDRVCRHYYDGARWIWEQRSFGPNPPATHFAARDDAAMIEMARFAASRHPGPPRFASSKSGGTSRLEALQKAGIAVRL